MGAGSFHATRTTGTVSVWEIAWIGGSLLRLHLGIDWARSLVLLVKAYFVFIGVMLLLEMGILVILGTMVLGPR